METQEQEANKKEEEAEDIHRPHVCNECGQSFNRAHNLKSHLATHSTERPFQCTTCNHLFRRQHDLKRHQKLHTGERPHQCNDCGRSFARLDALTRHQRAEISQKKTTLSLPPLKDTTSSTKSNHHSRITLPSPDQLLIPLQDQLRTLEEENQTLKQQLQQFSIDHIRLKELEKENELLKSIIQEKEHKERI